MEEISVIAGLVNYILLFTPEHRPVSVCFYLSALNMWIDQHIYYSCPFPGGRGPDFLF